jgi:microsomal epoxide hydrolase
MVAQPVGIVNFENVDVLHFYGLNLIRDIVVLVHALGYPSMKCVVGAFGF